MRLFSHRRLVVPYILTQTVYGFHVSPTAFSIPTLSPIVRDFPQTFFNAWIYGVDWSEQLTQYVTSSGSDRNCKLEKECDQEHGKLEVSNADGGDTGGRTVRLQFTPQPYPQDVYGNADEKLRIQGDSTVAGWFDPRVYGGRMLDFTGFLGEPMNVIISNRSDPYILTDAGLRDYSRSLGFANECMDLHFGEIHRANLGDGDGEKDQQLLMREYYLPIIGTCVESVIGGNHFRAWHQNGTLAYSEAWFLGVSKEEDSSKSHAIAKDGYNRGRDYFVSRAVSGTHWRSKWWKADLEWNEDDLLQPGNKGVNHGIAQDGRVAVLTVKRL